MKSTLTPLVLLLCFLLLSSCASRKPYYQIEADRISAENNSLSASDLKYSLFLVGGVSLSDNSPVLNAITGTIPEKENGLVLLGDVLSVDDLITTSPVDKIKALDQRYKHLYWVPGQKEWSSDKKISPAAIRSLDHQMKDVKEKGRLFQPAKGCGTPEVVRLTKNTILVLVDSQWAIEMETHPGEPLPGCELANILEWRQALRDIVQSHPTDHIVIATHHPVYANGPTAGNYPFSSHLLPLPVVGTIITGLKSMIGSYQHFGHPAYEAYRSALITAVDGCQSCVIVSGHEKSLQYYDRDDQRYMVAGSGSEINHARKGERSLFSYMSPGYIRIDEHADATIDLSFMSVDENGKDQKVWATKLSPPRSKNNSGDKLTTVESSILEDSVLIQASTKYSEKKFLRGHFYRKAWSEKIKIPVMWLDSVYGGLKPMQLGGGNQTRSLRMENAASEQYVIRSIDKKVTNVLPAALRGTFAENIVQDGIAASHPYGALVVPRLAKAAGIFYTNPKVVYIPHQAALGIYDQDVGDGIYLFEERPGGTTRNFSNFGYASKTINTSELLEMIEESPDHIVDQKSVLRARLFDIWLGDWDRHDDQWRWAAFEENNKTVYRPIPRDRDQVFFKNDGLLDHIASRPYFNPPLRRFEEKIDYLPGLVWAGKYFDRSFLHTLTEEGFRAEAAILRHTLSDAVIDSAFLDWPKEIDRHDGPEIRAFLRARRDDLVEYASLFYNHLSAEVTIPGSDDQDLFAIHVVDDDHIQVSVERKTDEDVTVLYYQRTIEDAVTKEIRLFGLDKRDTFILKGDGNPSILIRIVGGSGEDVVINSSTRLHIKAYDDQNGMTITGEPVQTYFNDKPFNNSYDRTDWKINKRFHFPSPGYFTDEGVGLTYNYWWLTNGFRYDPYKSRHTASLSYFFGTEGFIGKYRGEWLHALGENDFGMEAYLTGPTFTQYFFGLGNEYVEYGEKNKYHIVKGSQIILSPSLSRRFGFGSTVSITPSYQFLDLEDSHDEPRFVYTPEANLDADDFGHKHYASIKAAYRFERLDNAGFPTRGSELEIAVGGRTSIGNTSNQNGLLSGSGSLYIPFDVTGNIVLATHFSADKIIGDYEFFHALTLGGPDKLRGFRRDRFAGDVRFYQATDLRIKLFRSHGFLPFSFGVYGSFDYGRLWYKESETTSNEWHTALGGGVYLVPLGLTAFRLGIMIGNDDKQINIGGALRF